MRRFLERAAPRRPLAVGAAATLCVLALALAARSVTYARTFQEWRYARMPLERLAEAAQGPPYSSVALYYYGRALDARGQYDRALPLLEKAVGLDPDDARLRGEWSMAQLSGGYITGAFGQLTQFVRTHPDSAEGRLFLGRFYIAQNSFVRATEELEAATRLDSGLAEAWSLLAGARLQMGGLALARDAARKAVALRPERAVDRVLLASLLASLDDPAGAREQYEKAVALAPDDGAYLSGYARFLLKSGRKDDLPRAEALARRATLLNPGSPDGFLDLGRALVGQGKQAEALAPLEKAASMLPPGAARSTRAANMPEQFLSPGPALELARAYRAVGDIGKAREWEAMHVKRQRCADEERRLGDALRNRPGQKEVRWQMARFLARRGDVEGTARNIGQALGSATDAPAVLVATANALTDEGYGELAAPLARRALRFTRNSPAAEEAAGNALLAIGQAHEASVHYTRAAAILPEKLPVFRQKIAAYYRQRKERPSPAEALYQRALRIQQAGLGLAHNLEGVKPLLREAIAREPRNTDFRRAQLRVLVSRNEQDEARQAATELLEVAPDDGLGHAFLAALLLEQPDASSRWQEIEEHLTAAEDDDSVLPTVHYAQGVLALRRDRPQEAVELLRRSAREEPADRTYYQLAQAERQAGLAADAERTMAQFTARVERKKEAMALLQAIAERPSERERYERAIRFFTRNQWSAQADAVRAEMQRRFGGSRP